MMLVGMPAIDSETLSVAFLSPGWPAGKVPNGIVTYTSTMVDALRPLGVRSKIISTRPPLQHDDAFVSELARNGHSFSDKVLARVAPVYASAKSIGNAILRELLKTEPLDILEMEESYGWARFIAPKSPVPVITRLHGPWFLNGVANGLSESDATLRKRDHAEKIGLLAAHGVSSPTLDTLNRTRRQFGIELPDARVIYNPVMPVALAERWKLDAAEQGRILFVGRFDKHKGGDLILDAFALVAQKFPHAQLTFVGPDRGLTESNGKVTKFEDYVRRVIPENLRSRIEYLGFRSHEQIPALRRRAAVTVSPSRYEVFGIATAEALAMGCPVIAADAGGLSEVVRDGQTGMLCRPGDARDLSDKIGEMLSNPARSAEFGVAAAVDAAARFAPSVIAEQTLDFYRTVIKRFRGSASATRRV